MALSKFILINLLIAFVSSIPLEDTSSEERGIPPNDLFHQLNQIIGQTIASAIGDQSIEIGDKISSNKSGVQISVQKFSSESSNFPVTFQENNGTLIDDKEIIPVEEIEDEDIYKLQSEDSHENTSKRMETTENQPSTTESSDQKLLKAVASQPILTTV